MEDKFLAADEASDFHDDDSGTWEEIWKERDKKSIIWQHYGIEIPLLWRGIVNDVKFYINRLRKERKCEIRERVKVVIQGLNERQQAAVYNEAQYLTENCFLDDLVIISTPPKNFNCEIMDIEDESVNVFSNNMTKVPVRIAVIRHNKNKTYYMKTS